MGVARVFQQMETCSKALSLETAWQSQVTRNYPLGQDHRLLGVEQGGRGLRRRGWIPEVIMSPYFPGIPILLFNIHLRQLKCSSLTFSLLIEKL